MPIYEYICTECEHAHEALQKLSDAPLKDCPACGNSALKKKVSAPGFRLSGSGWYETDFKSDKQKNLADKSNDAAAKSGSADKSNDAPAKSGSADKKETSTSKEAAA